jgi:mannose-6-phosphate isomerase-like protein (cupin superfamily)
VRLSGVSGVRLPVPPDYTWLEPGGGVPAHVHTHQEDRWSVLKGNVRFRLGREKRVIGPGDGEMVVAPGVTHSPPRAFSERG